MLMEKTDHLYRSLKDLGILYVLDLEVQFVKENVVIKASINYKDLKDCPLNL